MVRDSRIKTYDWSGQAMGGSNLALYTSFAINGQIQRMHWRTGSYASNGSYYLYESGTGDVIHVIKNLTNAGLNVYPQASAVDILNTGSGTGIVAPLVVNNILLLSVSGNYPGSYFGGATLYYI